MTQLMTTSNPEADKVLFIPAGDDFAIVSHVEGDQPFGRDASNLPLITWPNGGWCFDANAFMLRLVDRGLSRFNRGGTLATYAAHITPLLRYCENNNVDLVELTDAHFSMFVNSLKAARFKPGSREPRLEPSTVISTASTCLAFLSFVGELHQVHLVGPEAAIRAEIVPSRGRRQTAVKWHHHSFPTRSPERRRLPVGSEVIAALRNAAAEHSPSNYIRRRRQIMLRLLEITGARRSEIAALTVQSVERAAAMQAPRLELVTKKGRGRRKDRIREVPITKSDARLLLEFARVNRSVVIRRTCGRAADPGALLLSETSGFALRPNTITQEVSILVRAAGLYTRVCAHMFRHRFITNVFKALIEEYHVESPDAFRQLLLSAEELKTRVCEWSGHSSLASLARYIHLAFEEVGGVRLAVDAVRAKAAINSFVSELRALNFANMTAVDIENLQRSAKDLTAELSATEGLGQEENGSQKA